MGLPVIDHWIKPPFMPQRPELRDNVALVLVPWSPCNRKWGPAARRSKAKKEASWWKGKFALFWMPVTWGGGEVAERTPVQRPPTPALPPPPLTIRGQELL